MPAGEPICTGNLVAGMRTDGTPICCNPAADSCITDMMTPPDDMMPPPDGAFPTPVLTLGDLSVGMCHAHLELVMSLAHQWRSTATQRCFASWLPLAVHWHARAPSDVHHSL